MPSATKVEGENAVGVAGSHAFDESFRIHRHVRDVTEKWNPVRYSRNRFDAIVACKLGFSIDLAEQSRYQQHCDETQKNGERRIPRQNFSGVKQTVNCRCHACRHNFVMTAVESHAAQVQSD